MILAFTFIFRYVLSPCVQLVFIRLVLICLIALTTCVSLTCVSFPLTRRYLFLLSHLYLVLSLAFVSLTCASVFFAYFSFVLPLLLVFLSPVSPSLSLVFSCLTCDSHMCASLVSC